MDLHLYPFQQTGVDFLSARKEALLADEMGLGKTPQAIIAAHNLGSKRTLVVCPATIKLNWQREYMQWTGLPEYQVHIVNGTKATIPDCFKVIIINYDLLRYINIYRQLIKLRFGVGIFDEAHYLKGQKSKRTGAILHKHGIASRCVHKWFLTGTPVLNRPIELYPILKAAAPDVLDPYRSATGFAQRYCGGYWDGLSYWDRGATHCEELGDRLRKRFMLRRLKSEVLTQLPAKQYQVISMAAPNSRIENLVSLEFNYRKAEAKYVGGLGDGSEIALERHELAEAKIPTAVDLIRNHMDQIDKLVVFAHHRIVISELRNRLAQYNPVVIQGGMSNKRKQESVDKFQDDLDTRIFLGQITAAGLGITLTAASTVLFVESSWVPGHIDQAVDRVHRIGQTAESILVQFLVIRNSLEEHMLRTVIDKREVIGSIVNEDIFS